MDTLYRHVNDATRRTLEANGYGWSRPRARPAAARCTSTPATARRRRRSRAQNLAALADSAGLHRGQQRRAAARCSRGTATCSATRPRRAFGAKVRDVSELLAERGPRPGGALPLDVAYDAPCHLQHAQRVQAAPLAVLGAIPGAPAPRVLPSSDKCCGSAGIYSVLRPAMARAVLDLKLESFAAARPDPGGGHDRQSRLPDADRRGRPGGGPADPRGASGRAAG